MKQNEPVNLASLVNAAVMATVGCVLFLLNVSGEAATLILGVSGAWTAVINWYIARRNSVPLAPLLAMEEARKKASRPGSIQSL